MRTDIYTEQNGIRTFDVRKILGRGYNNGFFTNFKGRYRFYVGSRASKKSQNIMGYEPIFKILSDPRRNVLFCRMNDVDNRTSNFPNIISCIEDLGLTDYFKTTTQPLEITYKPTGQKIIFKGINNPTALQGLKFATGVLSDIYIDECSEVDNYSDFMQLDGSLRISKDLEKDINIQITCLMNPWNPEHWIYQKFFKNRLEPTTEYMETHMWAEYKDENYVGDFGIGIYLHISCYRINEFLNLEERGRLAMEMKKNSPELYRTNFLGLFGATTGLCYPEFKENCYISAEDIMKRNDLNYFGIGIDTGLSNGEGKKVKLKKGEDPNTKIRSATTMILGAVSRDFNDVFVVDEYFHSNNKGDNETNTDNREDLSYTDLLRQIMKTLVDWVKKYSNTPRGNLLMKGTVNCYVDNADQATIDSLQMMCNNYGLYNFNFLNCTKKPIQTRVDFERLLMAYSCFHVNKDWCPNTIREYKTARKGEDGSARAPGNDHCLDSVSYSLAPFYSSITMWKTQFKEH